MKLMINTMFSRSYEIIAGMQRVSLYKTILCQLFINHLSHKITTSIVHSNKNAIDIFTSKNGQSAKVVMLIDHNFTSKHLSHDWPQVSVSIFQTQRWVVFTVLLTAGYIFKLHPK